MLQNINAPDLRDHDKNEVEDEKMSENDASIYASIDSSINEGKAHLIVLWKLKNVTII